MTADGINSIKNILATTSSITKRTYALWSLLTYHSKSLTTDELFTYIPLIWQVDTRSNQKFSRIRQMLEKEIRERQDIYTINKLLGLLKHDDPHLRFVGADLLNSFTDDRIIEPLLLYLTTTADDHHPKGQAICALNKYKDERIKDFLINEYEKNKENQDAFFRSNYLRIIEVILNKYQ
jgi:hypothetical protein